jgi:5'(3')-deoxyribonucleotidase
VNPLTNKTIAVDVDNVLAYTNGMFVKIWNNRLDKQISLNQIKDPKIVGSVRADPKFVISILDEVWENWTNLPLIEPDAAETCMKLRNLCGRVIIATSRPKRSIDQVKSWLNFKRIKYDEFISIDYAGSKTALPADILIDDDTGNIGYFADNDRIGILYDQPWNKSIFSTGRIIRIKFLSEILTKSFDII